MCHVYNNHEILTRLAQGGRPLLTKENSPSQRPKRASVFRVTTSTLTKLGIRLQRPSSLPVLRPICRRGTAHVSDDCGRGYLGNNRKLPFDAIWPPTARGRRGSRSRY